MSATALYEKLGVFYLGKPFDLATNTLGSEPVLYDSKDLVTHAVIVGMTGSGKTGLGMSLIEEAAIDGVPVLAIDPKGDLGNLLLTFPNLAPADFEPWVDPDEAARQRHDASTPSPSRKRRSWKKGLADWGQDGERIARLRAAADFAIYTPGSRAGRPVSILESFDAPSEAEREDAERLAEAVTTTATERADAARRRRRSGAEPRAHPAVGDPERRLVQGREPRSRGADPPHPAAAVHARRRPRPRGVLSRRRIASRWRCASTACWRRRASRCGSKASRSTSPRCSTRRRASRASRSSRSRTWPTRSGCSS